MSKDKFLPFWILNNWGKIKIAWVSTKNLSNNQDTKENEVEILLFRNSKLLHKLLQKNKLTRLKTISKTNFFPKN